MGIQICISQQRRDQTITTVMDEKYDLKWKTFNAHLIAVFKDLGEEGHFADVTLVSDDQIQTKAHKVVLSACSPVLKTLLVNNPHSHPLLYLRGIKQTELEAILKFMYFGETQIFEKTINDFINVAKDLEVKEISEEQLDGAEEEDQSQSNTYQDATTADEEPMIAEEPAVVKEEQTGNNERSIARPRQKAVANTNSEGSVNCDECEATFSHDDNLYTHKKSKHGVNGYKYYCDECYAVYTQDEHLKTHKKSKHTGETFKCDECDAVFNLNRNLTRHKQRKHTGVCYLCTEYGYQCILNVHTNSKQNMQVYDILVASVTTKPTSLAI